MFSAVLSASGPQGGGFLWLLSPLLYLCCMSYITHPLCFSSSIFSLVPLVLVFSLSLFLPFSSFLCSLSFLLCALFVLFSLALFALRALYPFLLSRLPLSVPFFLAFFSSLSLLTFPLLPSLFQFSSLSVSSLFFSLTLSPRLSVSFIRALCSLYCLISTLVQGPFMLLLLIGLHFPILFAFSLLSASLLSLSVSSYLSLLCPFLSLALFVLSLPSPLFSLPSPFALLFSCESRAEAMRPSP